jgi:hypothetical protein
VIAQIAVMVVLVTAGVLFLGPAHAFSPAPVWADPLPGKAFWQALRSAC